MSVVRKVVKVVPAAPNKAGIVLGITDGSNQNVALGQNALIHLPEIRNTAIGDNALSSLTGGRNNVAVGDDGLQDLLSGLSNTAIGHATAENINYLDRTVLIGTFATSANQTYQNVHVGNNGGSFGGNNNVTVGYGTTAGTHSNNIVIGANAQSSDTQDNEVTIGDTNISKFRIPGLGIDWTPGNKPVTGTIPVAGTDYIAFSEKGVAGGVAILSNVGSIIGANNNYTILGVGSDTLSNNTGDWNHAFGAYALQNNTNGSQNVAVGPLSLKNNTNGGDNVAVGISALHYNTSGSSNVAVGSFSLQSNVDGYSNTSVGEYSQLNNSSGYENSSFGAQSLVNNTTGRYNVSVGSYSLYSNTTGEANTAIGKSALSNNTTGYANNVLGYQALVFNTTGAYNTAIGYNSQYFNTTGYSNISIGFYSLYSNTTGPYNTAIGDQSLQASTGSGYNTALGALSGFSTTSGASNVFIGYSAGSSVTTGGNNLILGYNADATSSTTSNEITLGNTSNTTFRIPGINFKATGASTGATTITNDVIFSGNVTINGTTETINSTTVSVADKNIELGKVSSPSDTTADGGGITLKGATDKTFNWVNATGAWTSSENIDIASGKTLLVAGSAGGSGQYLQSTGTGLQWSTVSGYTAPTIGTTSIGSGATITTLASVTLQGPKIDQILASSASVSPLLYNNVTTGSIQLAPNLSGGTFEIANGAYTGSNSIYIASNAASGSSTSIFIGSLTTGASSNVTIPGNLNLYRRIQLQGSTSGNTFLAWPAVGSGGEVVLPSSGTLATLAGTETLTNKTLGATSTTTLSSNTATAIDTVALNSFTTIKYVISIKQGTKVRSSEVLVHTDGTSVNYVEYGTMTIGTALAGFAIAATTSSTNAVLNITITDAATTNATIKINKVVM